MDKLTLRSFKHWGWGWLVTLVLPVIATYIPEVQRGVFLVLFVIVGTLTFHNTEFVKTRLSKLQPLATIFTGILFCLIAVALFAIGGKLDRLRVQQSQPIPSASEIAEQVAKRLPQVQATAPPPIKLIPKERKKSDKLSHDTKSANKKSLNITQVVTEQRPYDLTGLRRQKFLELLRTILEYDGAQKKLVPQLKEEARDTIKIGCIGWNEHACVAAGRFLILFSEAGWTIDSNRVFRMEAEIPTEGIAIVAHSDTTEKLPPHMGTWQKMDNSQITIWNTFTIMGIPVTLSSDPTMPKGTLGVYFEEEPATVEQIR